MTTKVDTIGGFPEVRPDCKGCGAELKVENAWMTDGCPCNTALGVNSMNETRWRLLMQLQQEQSRKIESLEKEVMRTNMENERSGLIPVKTLKSSPRYEG